MNIRNEVSLVLQWCIENMGTSEYHDSIPTLEIGYKPRKNPKSYGVDVDENNVCGLYFSGENKIRINIFAHRSKRGIYSTIIHEYTHYLQNLRLQSILMNDPNYDYYNDPFEIEAHSNEKKYINKVMYFMNKLHMNKLQN